jgi:hypothetical protein
MSTEADAVRRQVNREVHQVLDSLLPHLAYEEVVGLLGSLRTLSTWPHFVPRAFSFASDVVRNHPAAASPTDATSVAELALAGGGHGQLLTAREAVSRLNAVSEWVDPATWAASELLGSKDLEALLGVRRSTIHNWRTQGLIVGLRKGLRNFVYPKSQFDAKAPVAGLREVIAAHPDQETAWEWLVAPNPATGWEPPLKLLKQGEKDLVLRALDSQLDYA